MVISDSIWSMIFWSWVSIYSGSLKSCCWRSNFGLNKFDLTFVLPHSLLYNGTRSAASLRSLTGLSLDCWDPVAEVFSDLWKPVTSGLCGLVLSFLPSGGDISSKPNISFWLVTILDFGIFESDLLTSLICELMGLASMVRHLAGVDLLPFSPLILSRLIIYSNDSVCGSYFPLGFIICWKSDLYWSIWTSECFYIFSFYY